MASAARRVCGMAEILAGVVAADDDDDVTTPKRRKRERKQKTTNTGGISISFKKKRKNCSPTL